MVKIVHSVSHHFLSFPTDAPGVRVLIDQRNIMLHSAETARTISSSTDQHLSAA